MKEAQSKQAGFSIVEALIAVVIVGAIGTVGWLVYQHNQVKVTNAAPNTNTNQQSNDTTVAPTTPYFTIKEWGVRAPYSGSLKLSYTISTGDKSVTFSSDQLTALSSACTGYGGSIIRWAASDQVSEGTSDPGTPTASSYFAKADPSTYAHVGSYYYTFAHAQSACGDLNTTTAVQSQTNDAVKALLTNLQAIPN